MVAHPHTPPHIALTCVLKFMNDTLGPEGLMPSALVFEEFPQLSNNSEPRPARLTLGERADLATTAGIEMEKTELPQVKKWVTSQRAA